MKTIPFYLLLTLLLAGMTVSASNCKVCASCTNCGPDILGDSYLDEIDALMQAKVQSLGYPLTINRNVTASAITYTIQYSSGLLIVLQLSLANMQIQLLSYSINNNITPTSAPAQPAPTAPITYKTTSDGYYILESFSSSPQVSEIMTYLGSVIKSNLSNFQLVGVQFTNSSAVLYRLAFKVLPASSGLTSIVQTVLVQYIGSNNCLLIDSNYSSLSTNLTWAGIDNKAILNDPFIAAINSLLLQKYSNLLGPNPTIVSLAQALPYYQVVYQVDTTSYSFIILYDYFQNRILQGNLTTYKSVTTYTQASNGQSGSNSNLQSGSSSSSSQSIQSSSSSVQTGNAQVQSSNSYTPSSSTNAFFSESSGSAASVNLNTPVVTVKTEVANPQTYYSVTTSPSSTGSTSNSQNTQAQTSTVITTASTTPATAKDTSTTTQKVITSNPPSSTPTPVTTATSSTSSASSAGSSSSTSSSTVSSSTSSGSNSAAFVAPILTNSSSTTSSTTQSTTYQQIVNFQSSAEVTSALNFLNSVGQNISIGQVQSVQKLSNGGITSYLITIKITSLGSVAVTSKSIFYQYTLQLNSAGKFSVQQVSYADLNPPNFAVLTIDEVKKDQNIKIIARYLLSQQYAMLSSNSQVLAVYRDVPYYQIVFQGAGNMQITFIILYGFNGSVNVMSATTRQVAPPQQTYTQAAAQAAANGQTSITQTTQATQSTQVLQNSQNPQASQTVQTAQTSQQIQNSQVVQTTAHVQNTQTSQAVQAQTSPTVSTSQTSTVTTQNTQNSQPTQTVQITHTSQTSSGQTNASNQNTVQPVLQQNTQIVSQQANTSSASQAQTNSSSQQVEPVFVQIKQVQKNVSTSQSTGTDSTVTQPPKTPEQPSTAAATSTTTAASSSTSTTSSTSSQAGTSTTSTTQNTNSQNTSTQINPTITGYNHFGSTTDQFYSFALQGVSQINQTLIRKGYSISEIAYKDIVYKLEGTVLTILFKVEAGGLLYTYQYKGNLGSSYLLTSTAPPAAVQTSSDTQNFSSDSSTVVSGGVTYQLAPSSLANQAYIQSYLNFLSSSDICYSRSNLVGIYVSTTNPNTLFFRFRNSTQYYNIVTNTVEIQRILNIYLSENNQQSSNPVTTTQSASTGQTQTTSTGQAQTTSNTAAAQSQTSSVQTAQQTAQQNSQSNSQQNNVQNTQSTQSASTSQTSNTQLSQASQTQKLQGTQSTQTIQTATIFNSSQPSQTSQITQVTQSAQAVQTAPIKSSQVITITNVDPHCLCYDQNRCLKCAHRYYLSNNQCIQVPSECLSYDINTGACVKCMPGYSLINGLCHLDDITAYYYEGQCFQCLGDYRLVNRKCVYAPVTDPKSPEFLQTKNPLCLSWNNGVCDECLPGTYLSSRQICELVDPFCSLFDYSKEICNTCREGFTLRNGKCFTS